jgi:hypothetical protein
MGARRVFPLHLVLLFAVAISTIEFNSIPFVVDTWSALLLGRHRHRTDLPRQLPAGRARDQRYRRHLPGAAGLTRYRYAEGGESRCLSALHRLAFDQRLKSSCESFMTL